MLIHALLAEDALAKAVSLAEKNLSGANSRNIYEQLVLGNQTISSMQGHDIMTLMKWDLANLPTGFKLSFVQQELTQAMLLCLVPLVFGSDFDRFQVEIMAMYGMTEVRSDLIAIFPRRFGKTTAASAVSYTSFRRMPFDQILFAQEKSHAQELLNNVREMFMCVDPADRDFQISVPNNKDAFTILDLKTNIKRSIRTKVARGSVSGSLLSLAASHSPLLLSK